MAIQVFPGNIAEVPADVLIAFVNSHGAWNGGVDRAIKQVTDHYHRTLKYMLYQRAGNFINNSKILVRGDQEMHSGGFDDVLFVIDDTEHPIPVRAVVSTSLFYAAAAGAETISLPVLRTGVMVRMFPDVRATVIGIARGILDFAEVYPDVDVKIVVYDDPKIQAFLQASIG